MEPDLPPDFLNMLSNMQQQLFQAIAPMLRINVRAVLERNDKLVNQDATGLDFLTEELIRAILEPPAP
jgi:hypothetical protein